MLYMPVIVLLSEWFVQRRGLAGGIIFAGSGIGGTSVLGMEDNMNIYWPLLRVRIPFHGEWPPRQSRVSVDSPDLGDRHGHCCRLRITWCQTSGPYPQIPTWPKSAPAHSRSDALLAPPHILDIRKFCQTITFLGT